MNKLAITAMASMALAISGGIYVFDSQHLLPDQLRIVRNPPDALVVLSKAASAAMAAPVSEERTLLLATVSEVYGRIGRRDLTAPLAEAAVLDCHEVREAADRGRICTNVYTSLAAAALPQSRDALQTATKAYEAIWDPEKRLSELTTALLRQTSQAFTKKSALEPADIEIANRFIKSAVEAKNEIPEDSSTRYFWVARIARYMVVVGEGAQARRLLLFERQLAEAHLKGGMLAIAKKSLALGHAGAGDFEGAIAIALQFVDNAAIAGALAEIAEAQAETDAIGAARTLTLARQVLAKMPLRTKVLTKFVAAEAALGDFKAVADLAIEVLESNECSGSACAGELVIPLTNAGMFDLARKAAGSPGWLQYVARGEARSGNVSAAKVTMRLALSETKNDYEKTNVALELVKMGDIEGAVSLAEQSNFPVGRHAVYEAVGVAMAKTGDDHRAEEYAKRISQPGYEAGPVRLAMVERRLQDGNLIEAFQLASSMNGLHAAKAHLLIAKASAGLSL